MKTFSKSVCINDLITIVHYLHESFGVVAGPLLEVSSLLKPAKAREEGC